VLTYNYHGLHITILHNYVYVFLFQSLPGCVTFFSVIVNYFHFFNIIIIILNLFSLLIKTTCVFRSCQYLNSIIYHYHFFYSLFIFYHNVLCYLPHGLLSILCTVAALKGAPSNTNAYCSISTVAGSVAPAITLFSGEGFRL